MRILLVSANYRPSIGGIERFVETLAGGLAERGHQVTVATCGVRGAPKVEQDGSVRIVRIPATDAPRARFGVPYPLPSPRSCYRMLRELLREADVVHPQDALYLTTVTALVLARRVGVPSVLTQHVAFVPQGSAVLDLAERAAIVTLGRCARAATVVAAYNPSVGDWAQRTWRLEAVRMLPIGVRPPPTSGWDRSTTRRGLGIPEDAFVALFSGRDVPKKRLDLFLAAAHPDIELIAVTDRSGGAPAGVRLVPLGSPDRFAQLLAAADAFVLPSEGEGFPLALQEALVAGVPCVVTAHPGYERFLRHDEVLFVPPDSAAIREALRRLAASPADREKLAAKAAAAGRREFDFHRLVDAYENLYAELGAGHVSGSASRLGRSP